MGKAGLAAGLFQGLQVGIQLGQKAKAMKQADELNKAKLLQLNNKALADANKAFTDSMNQYNQRSEKLLKQLNDAENETQRNSISKAIESLDNQWSSMVNAAAKSGVKIAGDVASGFNPYQHNELKRINVEGKDFTVPTNVYEDFQNNPNMYKVSKDTRGLVTKQMKSDTPLAGTEPEYIDGIVEGAVRSDSIFKESKLSKGGFEYYLSERRKEKPDITSNQALIEYKTKYKDGGATGTGGGGSAEERFFNEWSLLKDKGDLSPVEATRLRALNQKFDKDTYKKTTDAGNIGKAQEIFDKGFINRDWSKQDKNKAQILQSQILKATDTQTASTAKERYQKAIANNLVIEQAEDIISKVETIDKGKSEIEKQQAKKGYVDNFLTWVGARVDDKMLTESQAEQLRQNVKLNTRTGYLMSTYIKLISGTAAGEAEVARLMKLVTGGEGVTEKTLTTAIREFSEIAKEENNTILGEIKDIMPRNAMNIKIGDTKPTPAKKPQATELKVVGTATKDGYLYQKMSDGSIRKTKVK